MQRLFTAGEKDYEVLAEAERRSQFILILVDSDAFGHVCPPSFGSGWIEGKHRNIIGAGGNHIQHFGCRKVRFAAWNKKLAKAIFEVAAVVRPILSVGELTKQDVDTRFSKVKGTLTIQGEEIPLVRHRNLFYLPVKVRDEQALEPDGSDAEAKLGSSDNSDLAGQEDEEEELLPMPKEEVKEEDEEKGEEEEEEEEDPYKDMPELVESDSEEDDRLQFGAKLFPVPGQLRKEDTEEDEEEE